MGRYGRRTLKAIEVMLENPEYAKQYVYKRVWLCHIAIPARTLANMREPYRSRLKQLFKEELEAYEQEKQRKQQALQPRLLSRNKWPLHTKSVL